VHLLLIDTRNPSLQIGDGTFRQAVTESMSDEERRARRRLRRERRQGPTPEAPQIVPFTWERGDGAQRIVMTRAYHPRPLRGPVTLLVNQDWHRVSATLGWDAFVEDLNVAVIGQGHGLDWHIPEVANCARAWLTRVDSGGHGTQPHEPSNARPSPDVGGARSNDSITGNEPSTIADALAVWANRTPRAPALLGAGGQTFDYRHLAAEVDRLATSLRDLGIQRDDAVAIALPDGHTLAISLLACLTVGIAAPLPYGMTRHEYLGALGGGFARAVILRAGHPTPARDAADALGLPIFELTVSPPAATEVFQLSGMNVASAAPMDRPQPDDVALIISTSGTTGRPKRVPRTHRNIATTSADVARVMRMSAQDRCLSLAPMAFSQGLNTLLNSLWSGGSLAVLPGFDLARFPERVAGFRPTWFSAAPAVLRMIAMDEAASKAVRQFPPRMIRASAGALSAAEIAGLENRLQTPVLHSYGMSEAPVIATEPFGASERKLGSAGFVNHELKIAGEHGQQLPSGTNGEIFVRGPNVFPGYLDDPRANAAAFTADGWFRTGDVGWIDERGHLFVTGRLKDLIKRAGLAISPLEIEGVLLADAAVADACVFGVPHPALGEDLAAAVVVRPGKLATDRTLRERAAAVLSPAKAPRHIVFVAEIPRTPTGKPLRRSLAASVVAMLAPGAVTSRESAVSAATTALATRIADIWAGVLGFGPIASDDDLFDLGADSLQAARIVAELQQAVGIEIPLEVLIEDRTPARLAAWIAATDRAPKAPVATIVPTESAKRPLFFVSSANISSKNALRPARLGRTIDPDRPIHDLVVPPRLREASPHDSEEAARTAMVCIEAARVAQPQGPYLLIGVDEGGATACEMARQWEQAGELVHLLLLDAWNPDARVVPGGRGVRSPRRQRATGSDRSSSVSKAFTGPVTLVANRGALAVNATLGWGDVFGAQLSIAPFGPQNRSRRLQLEIAELIRTWLSDVEPG
ncbi:MAG: AMP-binding protein, partial [Thermomicrobiales bacterium]